MNFVACEPFPDPDFLAEFDVDLVEPDDVFRHADFLTLHTPLTDDTRNIVNTRSLDLMQPGCFIVNTARGCLVDEPHMAGLSQESMERMATIAAANVVAALRGDWNREMVVNGVYPE